MTGASFDGRRSFLKQLNFLFGGLIGAVMGLPALRYLLFPTTARIVTGGDEAIPVGDDQRVLAGGVPVRVEITAAERRDAWSKLTHVKLGAAWLVRGKDGQVCALSTTCPHLGCAIDFAAKTHQFRCPCHTSTFSADGTHLSGPAKRDMDPLPCAVENGTVKVRFQKYVLDTATRAKA